MAPKYGHLKKFSCVCYFHRDERKLQPREKKEIFIGYPSGVKGYKVWSLNDRKSVISRNVTFKETECYKDLLHKKDDTRERSTIFLDIELGNAGSGGELPTNGNTDDTTEATKEIPEEEEVQDEDTELENYLLARDKERRNPKPPKKLDDYVHLALLAAEDGDPPEPKDYAEAMNEDVEVSI